MKPFALGVLGVILVLMLPFVMFGPGGATDGDSCGSAPASSSATARRDIPPAFLRLYAAAGEKYGVSWTVLAGVGKIESDHGRLRAPGVTSGSNEMGAQGPMQFLRSTWDLPGLGNGGDPYNPADAIPAAARYLKMSGAPDDMNRALFAYNHSQQYVADVLAVAARYARGGGYVVDTTDPECDVDLERASMEGDVEGSPRHVINSIVLPISRASGVPRTVAENDAANRAHGPTVSGTASDHQGPPSVAWAADLSNGMSPTREMDKLAQALAKRFGIPWSGSGVAEATHDGLRFQMLYRTNVGGNHYNHVHIGIRKVGERA